MQNYIFCTKCHTNTADNWIKHKVSNIVETKKGTLHTMKHETNTFIFCPECYEKEAINAI